MEAEISCLFFCHQKQTVKKAENVRVCETLLSRAEQGTGFRVIGQVPAYVELRREIIAS
jgi:hypothetical protein